MIGKDGLPRNRNTVQGATKPLSSKPPLTAMTLVLSQILPDLDCTVCYKSTVTLANLCKQHIFWVPKTLQVCHTLQNISPPVS